MLNSDQLQSGRNRLQIAAHALLKVVLIPLVILLTTPFILFRQLHRLWYNKLLPDGMILCEMIKPMSHSFVPDYFSSNPRLNIVVTMYHEGHMTIEAFRELVYNNIVKRVSGSENKLKLTYPELTCKTTRIGGYYYWQKLECFKIHDYVHDLSQPSSSTTEKDLHRKVAHLLSKGWDFDKSPWEFYLVNNYVDEVNQKKPKTVLILRSHHHLGDGHAMRALLYNLYVGDFYLNALPKANSKSGMVTGLNIGQNFLRILIFALCLPYTVAVAFNQRPPNKPNSWKIPPDKRIRAGQKLHYSSANRIPVTTIKAIKNKFGVRFQAVLSALCAGVIRQLMEGMGQEVPGEVTALLPVPIPGHPPGMCNHFGFLITSLHVGEVDAVKRVKLAAKELEKFTHSKMHFLIFLLYTLIGLFPNGIRRYIQAKINTGHSLIFSPLPAVDGFGSCGGMACRQIVFSVGSGWGDAVSTVTATTIDKTVKFVIHIDQEICPSEEILDKLDQFIKADIAALESEPVDLMPTVVVVLKPPNNSVKNGIPIQIDTN